MAFDFSHIPVPFRMQPGLQRITPAEARLTPLQPGSKLHAEKSLVCQAHQAVLTVPGFDAANAIHTIALSADSTLATSQFDLKKAAETPGDASQALANTAEAQAHAWALKVQEDFCVIEGSDARLVWLCVCSPSHWAPEEKIGLPFAAVHAPVAGNAALLAATPPLLQRITSGEASQRYWRRQVWTITPCARYDQHPQRHPRTPWPAWHAGENAPQFALHFAEQCWLRSECQTFLPVLLPNGSASAQTLFTIRVELQPLVQAVQAPWQAQRLADSLASMTDAVLAYKNLSAARAPLLAWLNTRLH
ncbi:MAG: heme-dependent oxidative N-demethylase subunit alpha family protein [Burkholderiaceae bacterium]